MPLKEHPLAALGAAWLEWWGHAAALQRGGFEWLALSCHPRRLRERWLADWTETLDRYMRSPAFLEVMRRNLAVLNRSALSVVRYPR